MIVFSNPALAVPRSTGVSAIDTVRIMDHHCFILWFAPGGKLTYLLKVPVAAPGSSCGTVGS